MLSPIIDTHVHLDDSAFDGDRAAVLAAAREAGVIGFVNIGFRPESWEASRQLREANDDIGIVIGFHPGHADEFDPALDRALVRAVRDIEPLAVGETGFDFSRTAPSFPEQERAFRRQLEIASEEDLPVVIHQRQAGDALIAEFDRWPRISAIVLHSFDGDQRLLDWAVERRCHIGIGGLATRSGSTRLREILDRAPLDRLLLETDAPYLAPPKAPSRRNTPANLPGIAATLAPIWNLTAEELCWKTTKNARALFAARFGFEPRAAAAEPAP